MKPPCVVDFYLLSTEWSKNLFTIIIMDYKTADEKLPRNYALTFDLSDYVFSDSVWYQMLRDPEYFKKGKLCSHNHTNLVADCYLSWPDGQYVNILELYMDQRRNQAYPQVRGIGAGNRLYY